MKSNATILIVDDEAQIAKQTKTKIEKMGYKNINIAVTYDKAMKSIRDDIPDLILLDINLKSDHTGIDLANEKEVLNKIPIIYITGCLNQKYQQELMETNPKNYLSKPIRVEELEVNIALALGDRKGIIDLGYDFSYDFKNRHLFLKKEPIKLSKNEILILEKLIDARGDFVSDNILIFEVWGHEAIAKSSLRTLVSSLRKKLDPNKLNLEIIINISSFGYKLPLPKDEI